jgi:type IV secretory pathway VirB2 component (pilin)
MLILIILIISFFLAVGIESTVPMFMGIIASLLILSAKIVGKKGDEPVNDKDLLKKLLERINILEKRISTKKTEEGGDERDIDKILESLDRRITNLENYLIQVQLPQPPGIEFQPLQPETQEEVQEPVQLQEQGKEQETETGKAELEPEKQEEVQQKEQEMEQELEMEEEKAGPQPSEQEQEPEIEAEIAGPGPAEQEQVQEAAILQTDGMPVKTGGKLTIPTIPPGEEKKDTAEIVPSLEAPVSAAADYGEQEKKETAAVPKEMIAESHLEKKTTAPWKKIQQQFIENWTGILGSIIMVMGVAFLGIYTALKVSPVYRFMMLVVFSALLLGLFFFLKSKPKWLRLALWLRSGAAAIFLFACLGASTIDGLKWVEHPLKGTGLVLLLMGIVLNLYLSFIGGKQVFASLHVLLSLVALSIAPPTTITLIAAAIVTLFGTALTYREKWEYHLLLTISLFFAYHLYWYIQNGMAELSKPQHLTGIIAVAAVSVLALLVHYRSLYRTTVFERLPFFVHLSNWIYFGIGLYVHSLGSPWKPVVIGCGSIAAFLLARQARRLEIRWLFITDTLAAQVIALFALFSMTQWKVNTFFILAMMLLETLIFLVIMMEEKENLLAAIGTAIKYSLGTFMIAWAFYPGISYTRDLLQLQERAVVFMICVIFAAAFHFYLLKRFSRQVDLLSPTPGYKWLPFLVYFFHGFLAGFALYVFFMPSHWKPAAVALISITGFLVARHDRTFNPTRLYPLYVFGSLAAQAAAVTALLALSQWKIKAYYIPGLMFVEILLFFVLVAKPREKEKLLCIVGNYMKYIMGIILLAWAFIDGISPEPDDMTALFPFLVTLLAAAVFGTVFHFYLLKILEKHDEAPLKKQDANWQNFSLFFIHAFYAGMAGYVYFLDWTWKPPVIAVLSITGFLAARQAKTMEIKWLYQTGTLLAQAAALLALLSLSQWQVETYFSYMLMFIESLLFLVLLLKEKETGLRRIGFSILFIIAVVLTAAALGNIENTDTGTLCKYAIAFLVCTAAGTVFYIYTFRQFGETIASFKITPTGSDTTYSISAIGILLGWLLLAAFINTYQIPWWDYILAAAGIALIAVRRRYTSKGLGIGLMMFILGFHAFGWNNMSLTDHLPVLKKILYSLPFLMLSFAGIKMPLFNRWKRTAKAYGIYWFYLHLMVASYYIFTRISLNITGVLWLVFSIITLEIIYWLQKRHGERMPEKGEPDRFLLHMAYLLIAAFLIRHLAVHLHTTEYIGIFQVRLLVALGAIITFAYWTLRQLPGRENSAKSWKYIHPLFLDLVFVFSVFTVAVEVDSRWFPLTWSAAALICLIGAGSSTGETSRIRFYSLLLYWASTVYVALIPVTSTSTALHFYEKPWVIDSAAILLQFVYIVLIHKLTFLEGVKFPKLLGFLSPLTALINRKMNLWVHYPLFISVALFLYQAFDKSILTLLWVVECFLIFIAAVILKENHFRYLAMTGLALTLIRLVFYDLAKSDTFTRALVFIGVGILMLVMNSIYNKYKDRF